MYFDLHRIAPVVEDEDDGAVAISDHSADLLQGQMDQHASFHHHHHSIIPPRASIHLRHRFTPPILISTRPSHLRRHLEGPIPAQEDGPMALPAPVARPQAPVLGLVLCGSAGPEERSNRPTDRRVLHLDLIPRQGMWQHGSQNE